MIPKVFHHIWLGPHELPAEAVGLRETWSRHHPDWECQLWRDRDLNWLTNRTLFDRSSSHAQKADIARYEIIERYGGVYLDTDMECLRPIDELLANLDFFAGRMKHGPVSNSIFGAVKGHPLLREMVAALPVSCAMHRRIDAQSGPRLLTRMLKAGGWERREGVRVFPWAFFYPYDWSEPWRRAEAFPSAYAVHHWAHSWKGEPIGIRPMPSEIWPRNRFQLRTAMVAVVASGAEHLGRRVRDRVLDPGKDAARRGIIRLKSTGPKALPLGNGTILVKGPLNVRLLCSADDLSLTPFLALDGTYEPEFVALLKASLGARMTFVDVGANIGLHSVIAARLGSQVIAYECNPEMADLLERNVAMNWVENQVVLVRKAAGRTRGTASFWSPSEMKGLGSLALPLDSRTVRSGGERITIECEPLDAGLAEAGFIDLLKVDVEGGEADVLTGCEGMLAAHRIGMMALEYRYDAIDPAHRIEMESLLASLRERWHATFHIPGSPRDLPIDEVITTVDFPHLLVRFPWSTIDVPRRRGVVPGRVPRAR